MNTCKHHVSNLILAFIGTLWLAIASYGCIGVAIVSKGDIANSERIAIAVTGGVFFVAVIVLIKEIWAEIKWLKINKQKRKGF